VAAADQGSRAGYGAGTVISEEELPRTCLDNIGFVFGRRARPGESRPGITREREDGARRRACDGRVMGGGGRWGGVGGFFFWVLGGGSFFFFFFFWGAGGSGGGGGGGGCVFSAYRVAARYCGLTRRHRRARCGTCRRHHDQCRLEMWLAWTLHQGDGRRLRMIYFQSLGHAQEKPTRPGQALLEGRLDEANLWGRRTSCGSDARHLRVIDAQVPGP